jgi:hypothetical protein
MGVKSKWKEFIPKAWCVGDGSVIQEKKWIGEGEKEVIYIQIEFRVFCEIQ